MFVPLIENVDSEFEWIRDKGPGVGYTLSSGAGIVGRLSQLKTGSPRANGRTGHGSWTFTREGLLHPRITVHRAASEMAIGVLSMTHGGGGTLALAGNEYNFPAPGRLRQRWTIERGPETVARFERIARGARLTIEAGPRDASTLSILCLLGWHIALLADSDDSAIMTATSGIFAC